MGMCLAAPKKVQMVRDFLFSKCSFLLTRPVCRWLGVYERRLG